MKKKPLEKRIILFGIIFSLLITHLFFTGCFRRDIDDPCTEIRSLVYDGINRSYRVYIPDDTNEYQALLFVLHGGGGNGEHTEEELTKSRFNTLAQQNHFIVAYPDGIENRWNDGRTINNPVTDIDDVGFLTTLIETLIEEFSIDTDHVFVTGISNGGQMSYRLACEQTEKITAIAPVVSALHVDLYQNCTPTEPISVFLIAGTDDPLVPYEGGDIMVFNQPFGTVVSMNETVEFWVQHNNCSPDPLRSRLPDIDPTDGCIVASYRYEHGLDETQVLFYSITGGGHTWPSGGAYLTEGLVGKICYDFNACDHIWDFFQQYL